MKRFLGISGFTLLVALLLYFSFPGRLIDMKAYDIYSCMSGGGEAPHEIVVVGIDEASFAEMKLPWPWPRGIHGKLIKALRSSGAKGVVMDILFSNPSVPEEDRAMAEAIEEYGQVVLAADLEVVQTDRFSQEMLVTPIEEFQEAGALFGVSSIPLDADNVVRRFFWGTQEIPSLEVAVLRMLGVTRHRDQRRMIRFVDPAAPFPYVSYYKALEPDRYLPRGFFQNKMVLVGKFSQPAKEPISELMGKYKLRLEPPSPVRGVDMFATPFYILENKLTPGIEIHGHMLVSLMRSDLLRPLRAIEAVCLVVLFSFFLTTLNRNWTPGRSILFNGLVTVGYLLFSHVLFDRKGLFLPFASPLAAVVVNFVSSGVVSYVGVERKRRYLREAFSHYLSPEVARKVLQDPEKLRLGGQRVEATVLFSDLAGFTGMSEKMEPEEVVSILTRYTTEMTRAIFKYRGTLDKFIGDAIMAVWGTPTEDGDQAYHACLAALEMQKRMKTLAREFDTPEHRLSMRVGINTGVVMAGNMGSEERFDFTVIGDSVNIASRLEALSKTYGTEIIIGESTRQKLDRRLAFRELGSVTVKGKVQEIRIYELRDGDRDVFVERFEESLHLYEQHRFPEAYRGFSEALALNPTDGPTRYYLEQCKASAEVSSEEHGNG